MFEAGLEVVGGAEHSQQVPYGGKLLTVYNTLLVGFALAICYWVRFEVLLLTYETLYSPGSVYLRDGLIPYAIYTQQVAAVCRTASPSFPYCCMFFDNDRYSLYHTELSGK